jgi:hypothetical protein
LASHLDGVDDMTRTEAAEIAAAAFEIRDEIRAVRLTRPDRPAIH